MAEARRRDEWDRLSTLLAMTHNVNCARRADAKAPAAFNPFHARPQSPMRASLAELKGVFLKAGFREGVG